jgi:predicted helicase
MGGSGETDEGLATPEVRRRSKRADRARTALVDILAVRAAEHGLGGPAEHQRGDALSTPATPATPRARKTSLPKLIETYYADLKELAVQNVMYEMGVRPAFHALLQAAGKEHRWTLIAEQEKKVNGKRIRPDGTFKDDMNLVRGYWEAKDTDDKLDVEIEKKRKAGYPLNNIIFEDTATAVLYQHGQRILTADMKDPANLAELVLEFFRYVEPEIEEFEDAIDEFKERVPDLAVGLAKKIATSHKDNPAFKKAFADFFELCKTSLNPNLSQSAVDEMLIQHILTERLIREIFDNPEFVRRNVIAAEVEKVMQAMTSQSFDRNTYLKELDRFYVAIEHAARTLTDFSDKQHFLNTVYERFFQGYSVKLADTMGIVYTPQAIVDFMCASVEEVLKTEFGKTLASDDVYLIDPCTGTGNFIVNLIRRIPKAKLEAVYKHRLFANEIMLLPYYIAALNIEHAYFEQTGKYEAFEGLCFVDTLDMAEHAQGQLGFMTARNSERVERQRKSPITVVIGNPPYNSRQMNDNDQNKNRKYDVIDERIRDTYAKDSTATSKTALGDAYVKFFRWAVDRLEGRDGIVCYVTNNSFTDQAAFDGMRSHLLRDFDFVYHVDLQGNVRHNPKLSGSAYNVFGIQVGVGITVAARRAGTKSRGLKYHAVAPDLPRLDKLRMLRSAAAIAGVTWTNVVPDSRSTWINVGSAGFDQFISIGTKEGKAAEGANSKVIFQSYGRGVATSRDSLAYSFEPASVTSRMRAFADAYNGEVDRYKRAAEPKPDPDAFVRYAEIKWSRDLKLDLKRGNYIAFDDAKVRAALYRPFTAMHLFFDRVANEEVYLMPGFLPTQSAGEENVLLCATGVGAERPFATMASRRLPDLNFFGPGTVPQWFPFYVYDENGTNRRENITDWAIDQYRTHYKD